MKTNIVLSVAVLFEAEVVRDIADDVVANAVANATMRGLIHDGFRPLSIVAKPVRREHNVIDGPAVTVPRTAGS